MVALLDGAPAGGEALRALALVNYGHFTTMRVDEEGRVRGLGLHLERLERDCRAVLGAALDPGRVRREVAAAVRGEAGAVVARVTVFDPELGVGEPERPARPRVLVTTRAAGAGEPGPLRVRSCVFAREAPSVKHVGLFGALHQRRAARLAGFDDALFTGPDGLVSEGPTWNAGFVAADGTVVWPRAEALPGVTCALLRRAVPHEVAPVGVRERRFVAAFATNAAVGVRPIAAVDGRELDPAHPALERLQAAYRAVRGERLA